MNRVTITVHIPRMDDEEIIALKNAIAELIAEIEGAETHLTIMPVRE